MPGQSEAPPGLEGYFLAFFAFFTFFTFFAFFAFLAIASSFEFNGWKRDTRHARGGLASQQPQFSSEQIRGALPRAVTLLSSRYPQLLCVLRRFFGVLHTLWPRNRRRRVRDKRGPMISSAPSPAIEARGAALLQS